MAVVVTAAVAASSVIPAAAESLRHLSPPGASAGTATTATVTPSLPEAPSPPRPEALMGVAQRTPALRDPRGHRVPWVSLAQGSHGREGTPGLGGRGGEVSAFPPHTRLGPPAVGGGEGGHSCGPPPRWAAATEGGSTAILWGTWEDAAAQSPQPCPAPPGMAGGTWGQGSPRHPGTRCTPWPGGTQAPSMCESLCPHTHVCAAGVHCTGTIEAPPPPVPTSCSGAASTRCAAATGWAHRWSQARGGTADTAFTHTATRNDTP